MKKRTVLTILGLAFSTSLITLGFAAWTITGRMTGEATGNFQAYDATDNGDLTVELCDASGTVVNSETIIFGKPSAANTTSFADPWFNFSNMEEEVLDAYVKVTYTRLGDFPTGGVVFDVNHQFKEGSSDSSQTIVDAPAITKVSNETGIAYANNKITFTTSGFAVLKVSYKWGTDENGTNPYNYYNSLSDTSANRQAAFTYINNLYDLIEDESLNFVITVSIEE